MTKPKRDPELMQQIESARGTGQPVEAVVMLRSDSHSRIVPAPEEVSRLTADVLQRVTDAVGSRPHEVNIFQNLGSFALSASPEFLQKLLKQPEIASIMANRLPLRKQ